MTNSQDILNNGQTRISYNHTDSTSWKWKDAFCTRKWEKLVIILKDHVLYELEDIEDNLAKKSYVIVGYKIEPNFKLISSEENTLPRPIEGQAFCLSHPNMKFLLFYATNTDLASKWITALQEGTLMNETWN